MKCVQESLDHPNNQTSKRNQLKDKPESLLAAPDSDRIDVSAQTQVKNLSNQNEKEDHYACNLEVVEEVHPRLRNQFFGRGSGCKANEQAIDLNILSSN